jgi:thiamine monophosphate synthase
MLRGDGDVVQLREKDLPYETKIRAARLMTPICRDFDVLFVIDDSPELAQLVERTAFTRAKKTRQLSDSASHCPKHSQR